MIVRSTSLSKLDNEGVGETLYLITCIIALCTLIVQHSLLAALIHTFIPQSFQVAPSRLPTTSTSAANPTARPDTISVSTLGWPERAVELGQRNRAAWEAAQAEHGGPAEVPDRTPTISRQTRHKAEDWRADLA